MVRQDKRGIISECKSHPRKRLAINVEANNAVQGGNKLTEAIVSDVSGYNKLKCIEPRNSCNRGS